MMCFWTNVDERRFLKIFSIYCFYVSSPLEPIDVHSFIRKAVNSRKNIIQNNHILGSHFYLICLYLFLDVILMDPLTSECRQNTSRARRFGSDPRDPRLREASKG